LTKLCQLSKLKRKGDIFILLGLKMQFMIAFMSFVIAAVVAVWGWHPITEG
jgi:hypothetical protein